MVRFSVLGATTETRFPSLLKLIVSSTAGALLLFGAAGSALTQEPDDKPTISIENVVQSPLPAVFSLKWQGNSHLVSQTSGDLFEYWESEGAPGDALSIPIDGSTPSLAATGRFVSFSDDGRHYVSLIDGNWTVTSVQTGDRKPLNLDALDPDIIGPRPAGAPVWSPDGRYIALSRLFSIFPVQAEQTESAADMDPRVVNVGAVADMATRPFSEVVVFDANAIDQAPRSLKVEGSVVELSWGLHGELYFVGQHNAADPAKDSQKSLLRWRINKDYVEEVITRDGGILPYVEVSPNGKYAALVADLDSGAGGVFYSLFIVSLSDGTIRRLTRDVRIAQEFVWAPDSDHIFFPVRIGGLDQIQMVDLHGDVQSIGGNLRRHSLIDVSPSGKHLGYYTEDARGRRDIRVFDLESGIEQVVQTISNPSDNYALGDVERISWSTGEGFNVDGLLVFPPNYDPALKYPLLVDVHGGGPSVPILLMGPLTSGLVQGPLEWHASAAKGYVVFVPDFRSSGDYGPLPDRIRFSEGDFSFIDADVRDILSGIEAVSTQFNVDAKRIGILGHSAGGARANRLLQQSDVVSAAVLNEAIAGDALSTLLSLATGTRTGAAFESVLGRFHGGRLANSYENYTDSFVFQGFRISTPTLIMVGGAPEKLAVPALASEMLFSTLREYDVPTRMLRFVNEGHNYRDPEIAILAFNEMHDWFAEHMPN